MTKLQRVTDTELPQGAADRESEITTLKNGVTIQELPDYARRVVFPAKLIQEGLTVVFRDPSHDDFEQFELWIRDCNSKVEAMARLGVRLCTQWGERPGVTLEQWRQQRVMISATLMHILNGFFPGESDF
jgi:hypothetical protein